MRFHWLVIVTMLAAGGAACGEQARSAQSEGAPHFARGVELLADFSPVMPGRRPEVAVAGQTLVAYSGADLKLLDDPAHLAVSTDGGNSFRTVPFEQRLYNLGIVVRGNLAVVVGSNCSAPMLDVDGISCLRADERLQAFSVDLTSLVTTALPDPPVRGVVSDSVGASARASMFTVSRDEGPALLSLRRPTRWTVEDLPRHTSRACAFADTVVAVTNGRPIGTSEPASIEPTAMDAVPVTSPAVDIEPVRRGETLWGASVSDDQGATWSTPVPFASEADQDFAFAVGVACGPSTVAVYTKQLGVFFPTSRRWVRVQLPDVAAIGPGVAVGWTSPDDLSLWSLPIAGQAAGKPVAGSGVVPPLEHRRIDVILRDGRAPLTSTGPATETAVRLGGMAPQDLRGSGAEMSGYVLLAGRGKVVLANVESS